MTYINTIYTKQITSDSLSKLCLVLTSRDLHKTFTFIIYFMKEKQVPIEDVSL